MQAEQEAGPVREEEQVGSWFSNPGGKQSAEPANGNGVGRYLKLPSQPGAQKASAAQPDAAPPAKKAKQTAGYGNFDAW